MPRARWLPVVALAGAFSFNARAQNGTIAGHMIARETGEPLAYGIVTVDGANRSAFTSDSGRFAFHDLRPGRYTVRARRVGYAPAEVSVEVRPGSVDTLHFRLARLALRLDSIVVAARPACTAPGVPNAGDSSVAAIVAQVRLNAEQLQFMSRTYPFEYFLQVMKARLMNDGTLFSDDPYTERYTSKSRSSYRAGQVLRRVNAEYHFQIPELQDLASPQFLSSHCWHYAGIEAFAGRPHYRLDVVADQGLRGTDIDASVYVDTETFMVRQSVVRLSRRPAEVPTVLEFETRTYYQEILPSVPIIAHVVVIQTMDPRARAEYKESREVQHAFAYRYLGAVPPGELRERQLPAAPPDPPQHHP